MSKNLSFIPNILPINEHYPIRVNRSAGYHTPMFVHSNEYNFIQIKHGGQHNMYSAGTYDSSPIEQTNIDNCTRLTQNPIYCVNAGHKGKYSGRYSKLDAYIE